MYPKIYETDIPERTFKSLSNNTTLLLRAPTGYGKSVMLIDKLSLINRRSIIVIPNRPAVLALHSHTSELFPHHKIGYRMHDNSKSDFHDTVTLMTTGYFLEYITHNTKLLYQPLILAIDEAHENSWQIDLVVRIALWASKHNPKLKVILSSATLDVRQYLLNHESDTLIQHDIIETFDVKPNIITHYVHKESDEQVITLLSSLVGKNILVIMPGEYEIENFQSAIEKTVGFPPAKINQLHSKLTQEEIEEAIVIGNEWTIILSTNIIENSITIKKLDVVIDFGYRKVATQNIKGLTKLELVKASKSNLIQSSGRVGREGKQGEVYILLHEETYNHLPEYSASEAHRNPLYNQIFRLLRANLPMKKILCEPILILKLNNDIFVMKINNMVTQEIIGDIIIYKLTKLGSFISIFQLSLKASQFLSDVLLNADEYIFYYGVVISCWIDMQGDIFYYPRRKYKESFDDYSFRLELICEKQEPYILEDSLLTALTIWYTDPKYGDSGLHSKSMNTWKKSVRNTLKVLNTNGYKIDIPTKHPYVGHVKERLMYSLLNIYSDCIYNKYLIEDDNNVNIEKYSKKYEYNCLEDNNKFMALSSFEGTNKNTYLGKLIKLCSPVPSDKTLLKIHKYTGIPTEIWNNCILIYLDTDDIYKLINSYSNYM